MVSTTQNSSDADSGYIDAKQTQPEPAIGKRRLRFKDSRRTSPRIDQRKLEWTLIFLVFAATPFLQHLPIWPVLLIYATGAWRWWLRRRNKKIPHAAVRYLLTLSMAGVVYVTFGTFNGIEPGSSLLLVMAAMKLLESVAVRDLLVLVYMSFFMLLAAFLFDQSLLNTAVALGLVWMGTTTLIQVNRDTSPDPLAQVFKKSGQIIVQAMPLLLLLFLLFPRIPGPFWALPSTDNGKTGLSDNMSPGSISNLLESSEIAFRVYFKDQQPQRHQLYWRGPVLEVLDGREWRKRRVQTAPSEVRLAGPGIDYTMVLEPHQSHWLLGLDFVHAESVPRIGEFSVTGELISRKVVTERLRIDLTSHPNYVFAPELDSAQRALNLDTSRTQNPRTRQLAIDWRNSTETPAELIETVLAYYNQEPFVYSLTDTGITDKNSIDSFLFDRRRGFCEHYASSFALLMRYAGIPARVVTGYMGGEINQITGHTTVRQSDAHAWSEVWLEGRGWVRIDPTAAVAPERVEQGIAGALPDGEFLPTLMLSQSGLMTGIRQTMDAINANWNNWVLGYSEERQWSLLKRIGLKDRNLSALIGLLTAGLALILLALAWWLKARGRYRSNDPVVRLYHTLQERTERLGIDTHPTEDAMTFARRVAKYLPEHASTVKEFCDLYQQARYGRQTPKDTIPRLRSLLSKLPHRLLVSRRRA